MWKFLSQVSQDIDGAHSAKRLAFFVFIGLFATVTLGIHFYTAEATFLQGALDKITDIIKWLGGFIVAERAQVFGKKPDVVSTPVK